MTTPTPITTDAPELLTEAEAAAYLHVSSRTLKRWRLARRIGFVQAGRRPLYRQADIDAYLDAHAVAPLAPAKALPAARQRYGGRTARRRSG